MRGEGGRRNWRVQTTFTRNTGSDFSHISNKTKNLSIIHISMERNKFKEREGEERFFGEGDLLHGAI